MNPFLRVFTSFTKAEHDYHYQQLEKGSMFRAPSCCPHQQYDKSTPLSISTLLRKSYLSTDAVISSINKLKHTSRWCDVDHTLARVMLKRMQHITSRQTFSNNLMGLKRLSSSG